MTKTRKSGATHAQVQKLPPAAIGAPGDRVLNEALAIYNQSGNYIALWRALEVCLKFDRPIPPELAMIFREMAHRLLALSSDQIPDPRTHVADIVLGTNVVGGGISVFEKYRLVVRDRARLDVIDALVAEHIIDKPQESVWGGTLDGQYEGRKIEYAWTLGQIYAEAANALLGKGDKVEADTLKRLHEQADKDAGVFKTNAIVDANRKIGVVDIETVNRPSGRKRKAMEESSD